MTNFPTSFHEQQPADLDQQMIQEYPTEPGPAVDADMNFDKFEKDSTRLWTVSPDRTASASVVLTAWPLLAHMPI